MKTTILTLVLALFLGFSCDEEGIMPEQQFRANNEIKSSAPNQQNNGQQAQNAQHQYNGFDEWGFNYTAHLFKGYLINAIFGDPAFANFPHYKQAVYHGEGMGFWYGIMEDYGYFDQMMPASLLDCKLMMRWNEALLSQEAIYPDTWTDTDAWIEFTYTMNTGGQQWKHFRKLVAFKSTDTLIGNYWYDEDGNEIGMKSYYWPDQLMIIQVVNTGDNPLVPGGMPPDYTAPNGHGWGVYKPAR